MTLLEPRLLILLVAFLAVTVLVLTVAGTVTARQAVRRRVAVTNTAVVLNPTGLRATATEGAWSQLLRFIEARGLSLSDSQETAIAKELRAAGFDHPLATRAYTLIRLGLALGLPVVALLILYQGSAAPGTTTLYGVGVAAGLAGLYGPNMVVKNRAEAYRQRVLNGFPDALDLLLVCVEAGLSLDLAFGRVGREMMNAHPDIAALFGEVVSQLRAGRSREEALGRLGERAGVDQIRAFTTLLIQSAQLGLSIAQALRTFAAEMREQRRMRAEEKAHRIPVLISIPLVGCLLPVMMGVLMLPASVKVAREILPALGS